MPSLSTSTNITIKDVTGRHGYTAGFKGCQNFDLPVELPGYRHVFHLYVIETKKPNGAIPWWTFW